MNQFNTRLSKRYILVPVLAFTLFLSGCSANDAIHSFEKMIGLGMNSESADENTSVKVEIEYTDSYKEKKKEKPVPTKEPQVQEEIAEGKPEEPDTSVQEEYIWDVENKIYSKSTANPDEITISFGGDICFTEGCSVLSHIKKNGNNFATSFDDKLLARMIDSDIFMLNNEFPYSTGGTPVPNKDYTFRANPEDANLLFDVGTDIVSLANNHAFDYGEVALDDTLKTLRNINMPYVGAGENINEAIKPAYFKMNGRTVAIIAGTQIEGSVNPPHTRAATETLNGVFRCLDTTKIKEVIADTKTKSDFVIVFVHWGTEKTDVVRDWQKSAANDFTESGADLVIGMHSHCLQGIDYVNGAPVFYSLGNYIFNSNTQDTCLITVTLDTSKTEKTGIKSLQFVPCIQSGGKTVEASPEDWSRIIKYEQGISYHAALDSNGYITYTEQNMNIQNGQNTSPMRKKDE